MTTISADDDVWKRKKGNVSVDMRIRWKLSDEWCKRDRSASAAYRLKPLASRNIDVNAQLRRHSGWQSSQRKRPNYIAVYRTVNTPSQDFRFSSHKANTWCCFRDLRRDNAITFSHSYNVNMVYCVHKNKAEVLPNGCLSSFRWCIAMYWSQRFRENWISRIEDENNCSSASCSITPLQSGLEKDSQCKVQRKNQSQHSTPTHTRFLSRRRSKD